jgi:hypothetical protein
MARRLGIVWKAFDPSTGSMRAEGNGHVITSTMARSLGTILQYTFTSKENAQSCAYIPVTAADKLGFGLVEFDRRLFGTDIAGDLNVSNFEGIQKTLRLIVVASNYKDRGDIAMALENMSKGQIWNDLVPLCSAMLSTCNSSICSSSTISRWCSRIPSPNLFEKGLTSSQ